MTNKFDELEKRTEVLNEFAELVGYICTNCKKRKPHSSIENCGGGETISSRAICPNYALRMWGRDIPQPILKWLTFCDDPTTPARKDY